MRALGSERCNKNEKWVVDRNHGKKGMMMHKWRARKV
jgi:hypothetical protein